MGSPLVREVVTATFYNFSPALAAGSIPRAWQIAAPEAVIAEGTEEVVRIGQAMTRTALAAGAFPSSGVFAPAR